MKHSVAKKNSDSALSYFPFFQKESNKNFFNSPSTESVFFSKRSSAVPAIQTKLTIGESNDKYEQEADAMADKVVQLLATPNVQTKKESAVQAKPITGTITPLVQAKCATCEQEDKLQKKEEEDLVQESPLELQRKPIFESNAEPPDDENIAQRKCADCEKEEKLQKKDDSSNSPSASTSIESSLNSSKGSGSPIPEGTREQMESSFGADFSTVRLHTDSSAVQMNKDLHAQAFTHESDIYFNSGKYDTNSTGGKHLLAHELTHTVQQKKAVSKKIQARFNDNRTERQKIDDALASKDNGDVKEVNDFSSATVGEKIKLIRIMVYTPDGEARFWVGPFDEYKIQDIWESFGNDLVATAGANTSLWKYCIEVGADLEELKQIKELKKSFESDVKTIAKDYLKKNDVTVREEMKRLGLPEIEDEPAKEPTQEQANAMINLQKLAETVAQLQKARKALTQVNVGRRKSDGSDMDQLLCDIEKYNQPDLIDEEDKKEYQDAKSFHDKYGSGDDPVPRLEHTCKVPAAFDPNKPPDYPLRASDKGKPWEEVNELHKHLSDNIAAIANQSPGVYALIGQGGINDADEVSKADPAKARKIIGQAMRDVLKNIKETAPKIDNDDLDYRDLTPIHAQLFSGMKGSSGIAWTDDFPKSIAKDIVKDHEITQALIKLGLQHLAGIAFLVAEIATLGTATFFIAAAVAIGATGIDLAISAERYEDLAKAEKTNVTDKTTIISKGQVDEAKLDLLMAAVSFLLIAAGLSGKVVESIKDIRAKIELRRSAADIRAKYLGKPFPKGNVASAKLKLNDGTEMGFGETSRQKSPLVTEPPTPKSQGGQFEPKPDPAKAGGPIANTDPEYKILSSAGEILEKQHGVNAEGTLYLYSERQLCVSCNDVLGQFKAKFPKIEVKVFSDFPYP